MYRLSSILPPRVAAGAVVERVHALVSTARLDHLRLDSVRAATRVDTGHPAHRDLVLAIDKVVPALNPLSFLLEIRKVPEEMVRCCVLEIRDNVLAALVHVIEVVQDFTVLGFGEHAILILDKELLQFVPREHLGDDALTGLRSDPYRPRRHGRCCLRFGLDTGGACHTTFLHPFPIQILSTHFYASRHRKTSLVQEVELLPILPQVRHGLRATTLELLDLGLVLLYKVLITLTTILDRVNLALQTRHLRIHLLNVLLVRHQITETIVFLHQQFLVLLQINRLVRVVMVLEQDLELRTLRGLGVNGPMRLGMPTLVLGVVIPLGILLLEQLVHRLVRPKVLLVVLILQAIVPDDKVEILGQERGHVHAIRNPALVTVDILLHRLRDTSRVVEALERERLRLALLLLHLLELLHLLHQFLTLLLCLTLLHVLWCREFADFLNELLGNLVECHFREACYL